MLHSDGRHSTTLDKARLEAGDDLVSSPDTTGCWTWFRATSPGPRAEARRHLAEAPGYPLSWSLDSSHPPAGEVLRVEPTDVTQPQYYHKVVDCQFACPAQVLKLKPRGCETVRDTGQQYEGSVVEHSVPFVFKEK